MKAELLVSNAELEVLKVLWEHGTLTSQQIIDDLTRTTQWKPKTIQTLITRLVSKKAVKADKANAKAFLYSAAISREEYRKAANHSFLQTVYDGSLRMMLASLAGGDTLSEQDIRELRTLLESEEKK